jgi:hypothetical protein
VGAAASTTPVLSIAGHGQGAGDVLLTGSRAVPALAVGGGAGDSSTGTATVTIPSTIALGPYFLLACADDLKTVSETDEVQQLRRLDGTVRGYRAGLGGDGSVRSAARGLRGAGSSR